MVLRRKHWDPDTLPCLALADNEVRVDIGFLEGEEHRQAFASIFHKMLRDNTSNLQGFSFAVAESTRPITADMLGLSSLPVSFDGVCANVRAFALGLYDSGNERVLLELTRPDIRGELNVHFDNPEFWLSLPA